MAGGKLEWLFALIDKTSGPASIIEKKLEILEKRLKAVDKAAGESKDPRTRDRMGFQRMQLELQRDGLLMRRTGEATESWITRLNHALGLVSMLGGALTAVGGFVADSALAAGRLAFSFGKAAIDAASYKETNLIALGVLTGSEETARRMLKWGVEFAGVTPFKTQEILGWQKQLVVGQFKEAEVPVILKAVGDVGALHDFDRNYIERIIQGLSKVKAEGKLTGVAMKEFAEAGIPEGKVYERLAQIYGRDVSEVEKLRGKGGIGADAGVRAVLDVIRDELSGGKLGLLMDRVSQTVPGLMSTILSRPFEFMMDLDESEGFKSFKGALKNLLAAIDQNAGSIKGRIADIFNNLAGGLFGELGGSNGLAKAEEMVVKILDGVDRLIVLGKEAFALFQGMGEGFLGTAFGELKDLFQGPMTEEKLARITEAGRELGAALGRILDAVVGLSKALGFLGDTHWDTNSPFGRMFALDEVERSKKKGWLERMVDASPVGAAGRALTALQASPEHTDELLAQARGVTATPPSAPGQALVSRGASLHAPVTISVDARGATPETVSQIADQTKKASEEAMASSYEALQLCYGG